ncbi:ankyrin repeat protein [Dictyocaulus viviparus]|uniref:Ankyrin repeat protein n=1 Tax=Dictyocaulus viviparus TaxID=29172 RepID=A0A0D8XPQ7_DICVI|nr:ankyrin repeat protein [Dictyocaulus viviparus]
MKSGRRRRLPGRVAINNHKNDCYKNYCHLRCVQQCALQDFSCGKMISNLDNDFASAILVKNDSVIRRITCGGFDVNRSDSFGCSPLHYSAFTGDITTTLSLIEIGANVNAQDGLGLTPLHRAIAAKHFDVAELLIDMGCDTTIRCKLLQTPLHICAIHNVPSITSLLLRQKYSMLNSGDFRGSTALHHAAYRGYIEVADLLLKAGINMAAVDNLGRTAIHFVACGGHIPMLDVLRRGGASINVCDHHGRNVAHFAAMASQADLLEKLLNIDRTFTNSADNDGYTPLHYAVQNAQNSRTIELLFKNGCNINSAANDGTTALHISASLSDSPEPLEYLIKCSDINLNAKNTDGMTPLHLASEWSKVCRVDGLVQAGAEIDPRSVNDATPLHCAALGGHHLVVKHLLKSGADVNAKMKGELTPLHLAAYHSSRPVSQVLIEMGADIEAKDAYLRTPLHFAAHSIADSGTYTLEYLIKNKAVVNVTDKYGFTPLHTAALKGLDQMARAIADKPDLHGRNALHLTVLSRSHSTAEKLCLADEKCVYRQDCNGFYPLHYAAYKGDEPLCLLRIDFLFVQLYKYMKNLVDIPSSGNQQGITPIHLAAMRNMAMPLLRLAKEFKKSTELAARRDSALERPLFTCTDVKNRIPLHYAMKYGYIDPVIVLLSQSSAEVCLNWLDKDDITPLHLAAANGRNVCVEWVLNNFPKISVNRKDSKGRSCGMLSLTSLSGPCWPLILKSNLEQCDKMGRSYLHRAAYSCNKNAVLKILEQSCPNVRDVNGVTPLHVAAAVGNRDVIAVFLQFGADPLAKDNRGFTPVDWAAAYNQISSLEELILNIHGLSSDLATCSSNVDSSCSKICEDPTLSNLFTAAAGVRKQTDYTNCWGRAGLLFASYFGSLPCIMCLLEKNPQLVLVRDPRGRTALHLSAWNGHHECVKYLVDKGVEIEALDDTGATALMYAVKDSGSVRVLEYLLSYGADVSKRDKKGNTVLHHSCISRNENAGKVLTNYLSQFDPERHLCNAVNEVGETALHIALKNGLIEFLLCFIPFGSKSMWIKDSSGRIPLMCGVENQDIVDCMQLLLACMADSFVDLPSLLVPDRRRSLF